MRLFYLVLAPLVLFFTLLFNPCLSDALLAEFEPGYQIATLVQHSDLIVVGTVTGVDFAYRENIGTTFNTDITIAVESVIKGETNAGENTVKFMIKGGEGVDPVTGEEVLITVEHSPDFELNERVLVLLKKATRPELRYPYGGYYVFRGNLGKRKVIGDKLSMPYTFKVNVLDSRTGEMIEENVKKFIDLPVDLIVQLGKASAKDFEAAKPLEADIKEAITTIPPGSKPELDKETVDKLKDESKRILDKKEDDKPE